MDDLDRIFRRLVQNIRGKYPQYLSTPFSTEELYQVIVPYRHNRQELGIDTNQDYEMALMRLLSGERGYLVVDRDMRETLTRELESSNPDTSLFRAFGDRSVTVSVDAIGLLDPTPRASDDARMAAPTLAPRSQDNFAPRAPASSRPVGNSPPPPRARAGGMGTPPAPSLSATIPVAGMPLPPLPPSQARPQAPPPAAYATPAEPVPPLAPPRPAPIRAAPGVGTGTPSATNRSAGSTSHPAPAAPTAFTGFRGGPTTSPNPDMASTRRSITAAVLGGRCRYCSGTLPDGRQLTFCPHCGQDLTVQQCPACSTELELGWKFCTTCGRGVAQT